MDKDAKVREQILEAAIRVYIKWGLKKTTMEDIAAEAGKGKATLYYYFKNKEDVFISVLKKLIVESEKIIRDKILQYDSVADRLEQYMLASYEIAKKSISIFNFLRMDIRDDIRMVKMIQDRFEEHSHRVISGLIGYGVSKGSFNHYNEQEIETITYFVSASINNLFQYIIYTDDIEDLTDRIKTVRDFVIKGLSC